MTVEQAAQETLEYCMTAVAGDPAIPNRVVHAIQDATAAQDFIADYRPVMGAAGLAGFMAGLAMTLDCMLQQELLT